MIVTTTDLWRMSATELADAIRSKHVSSQEVIESHLRRIEAVNPSINAVVIVLAEQALEAAKAHGGHLPLQVLLGPAIRHASEGYLVTAGQARLTA